MTSLLQPGSSTPVRVIDPADPSVTAGSVEVDGSGVATLTPGDSGRAPVATIGPGWVDLHAHVYDGTTQISVHPDRVGLDHGVHTVLDAGSAGQATLPGLLDYVIPTAQTRVLAWLNIGSHGLVDLRETADARLIDVDASVAAALSAPDVVRGIKVRSSGAIVGNMGIQPLELGKLVARTAGLPLLVHIGEAPPLIDAVLDLLDAGDSITHCFHGKTGFPWLPSGEPVPALRRALDRGVRMDVGHGAASFDVGVARRAIAAGHRPHTISTDIHVRNIGGPVFDLATVMTKLLHCGMSLPGVVDAVTRAPRETIGLDEPWLGPNGEIRHATLFDVTDSAPAHRRYVDAVGATIEPGQHLVALATISGGVARPCG